MKPLTSLNLSSLPELVVFDFDGVFTDNYVSINEFGHESVCCFRGDGIGLNRIAKLGIKTFIVSTEPNPIVSQRAQKLQVPCLQGIEDKALAIRTIASNLKLSLDRTIYLANDINDIPALQIVGCPVGVADSHPDIYPHIIYITKTSGGHGAVRELCDHLLRLPRTLNF